MKIKIPRVWGWWIYPANDDPRRPCPLRVGSGGKGWHSPRIGRTKPGGHILKFSMTERASSYFIVSRFHRKFRAPLRLGRSPTAISHRVESPVPPSCSSVRCWQTSVRPVIFFRVFLDSPTWTHLCSTMPLRSFFLTQYNAPRLARLLTWRFAPPLIYINNDEERNAFAELVNKLASIQLLIYCKLSYLAYYCWR